jgi:septum site-determining protein MinD
VTGVVALVGACGGAGTTRTAVEFAAVLARDGRRAVVVDAAYATQGLSEYVPGRIDPDVTTVCTDGDADFAAATHDLSLDATGRVALAPARAPFERLARAQTVEAARTVETLFDEAADRFDHVLVDVPPPSGNHHVAAVTAADRLVVVAPGTDHGADAVRRTDDRLADLGVSPDAVVATQGSLPAAAAVVPEWPSAVADAPACLGDDRFAERMVSAAESAVGVSLGIEVDAGGVVGRLGERLGGVGGSDERAVSATVIDERGDSTTESSDGNDPELVGRNESTRTAPETLTADESADGTDIAPSEAGDGPPLVPVEDGDAPRGDVRAGSRRSVDEF